MDNITLSNGTIIPVIGFGTYKLKDEKEIDNSIKIAVNSGYTFIDTAYFYENESFIGDTLRRSNINRKNIIIATKVWPSDFGYDKTMYSIERSLKSLNTDYLDILYLHWPGDDMQSSWKAFEKMYDEKVVKNLAIANFLPKHYEIIVKNANIKPVINQVEIHPYKQMKELIEYYKQQYVQIISWSPIARADKNLFLEKILLELSEKYQKSIAQIILRWHIQKGLVVIPKTKTEQRIVENIDIFNFELDEKEMNEIEKLDKNLSVSRTPDDENWLRQIRYAQ